LVRYGREELGVGELGLDSGGADLDVDGVDGDGGGEAAGEGGCGGYYGGAAALAWSEGSVSREASEAMDHIDRW